MLHALLSLKDASSLKPDHVCLMPLRNQLRCCTALLLHGILCIPGAAAVSDAVSFKHCLYLILAARCLGIAVRRDIKEFLILQALQYGNIPLSGDK